MSFYNAYSSYLKDGIIVIGSLVAQGLNKERQSCKVNNVHPLESPVN